MSADWSDRRLKEAAQWEELMDACLRLPRERKELLTSILLSDMNADNGLILHVLHHIHQRNP